MTAEKKGFERGLLLLRGYGKGDEGGFCGLCELELVAVEIVDSPVDGEVNGGVKV